MQSRCKTMVYFDADKEFGPMRGVAGVFARVFARAAAT